MNSIMVIGWREEQQCSELMGLELNTSEHQVTSAARAQSEHVTMMMWLKRCTDLWLLLSCLTCPSASTVAVVVHYSQTPDSLQ